MEKDQETQTQIDADILQCRTDILRAHQAVTATVKEKSSDAATATTTQVKPTEKNPVKTGQDSQIQGEVKSEAADKGEEQTENAIKSGPAPQAKADSGVSVEPAGQQIQSQMEQETKVSTREAEAEAKAAKEKAEQEAAARAEAQEKVKAEQELKAAAQMAQAEAKAARIKAQEEAKAAGQKAEQEVKARVEAEKKAKAEADARAKAEQEAKAAVQKAEQEVKARTEAEEKARTEAEARTKAEQEAKAAVQKAEQEVRARIEAQEKARTEAEARAKAEQEAKAAVQKAQQEAAARAEAEKKAKAEADARAKAEQEVKALVEKIQARTEPETAPEASGPSSTDEKENVKAPGTIFQSEEGKDTENRIPRFNLAQQILAEQRKAASTRRGRPTEHSGGGEVMPATGTIGQIIREAKKKTTDVGEDDKTLQQLSCGIHGIVDGAHNLSQAQRQVITGIVTLDIARLSFEEGARRDARPG